MFRCRSVPLLAKVPYATLFSYNPILQEVFHAPADKVAICVETPSGGAPQNFTYGRLQQDVVTLANTLASRRECVAAARGETPLSWAQSSKPAHVRSLFTQGDYTRSCDCMEDTGTYAVSLMCGPGYTYVVSLLACWALNLMATPMSVSQRYNDELMYVLEHSGSRMIIGEGALLTEKFPSEYEPLYVRSVKDASRSLAHNVPQGSVSATYQVDTVCDAHKLIGEWFESQAKVKPLAEPEILEPADRACAAMDSAESVMERLSKEKTWASEREQQRLEDISMRQYKEQNAVPDDGSQRVLCFDTEKLDDLNPLFRRWYENPTSAPQKNDDCLMIYTSGTTARPKGVVHTHASVTNMVRVLHKAWAWSSNDSILHVLPVHHIHGLVNVLLCSLGCQARCVFTKFEAQRVAKRLMQGDMTLFMAVPTIYTKLIASINNKFTPIEKTAFYKACSEQIRLMVSGSAALPVPTLHQFQELSGHVLLERYGMTEIGMALSQPLRPLEHRIPGTVGAPLPSVAVCVKPSSNEGVKESGSPDHNSKKDAQYDEVGALMVASESLFDRYWGNPTATRKELYVNEEGTRFFDTGDTVGVRHAAHSGGAAYTILGRSSIDIIKSRGYKLSALEIEAALLSRKDIFYEVAVVGAKDEVLGEQVVAIAAMQPNAAKARGITFPADSASPQNKSASANVFESDLLTEELKHMCRDILAPYKCPGRFLIVPEIPRNPTGKVNKKDLMKALHIVPPN